MVQRTGQCSTQSRGMVRRGLPAGARKHDARGANGFMARAALIPPQSSLTLLNMTPMAGSENQKGTSAMAKTNAAAATPTFMVSAKVSDKGAVSIYGLGQRFPVTLYRDQLEAILSRADSLRKFMTDNAGKLAGSRPQGQGPAGATAL